MNTKNLYYVVYLVNRGDSSCEWTEKFNAGILEASSEDEAYKTALRTLPRVIGEHREGGEAPKLEEGDEKDCAVDVTSLDDFIARQQARYEDISAWEESPPF